MNIAFLVESVKISGGTYAIFEHAFNINRRTSKVTIITQNSLKPDDFSWHREASELEFITLNEAKDRVFDIAIATWWHTIYSLHMVNAKNYCYFVQSIEHWFYYKHENLIRKYAEVTYHIGIPIITEATWIKEYLKINYGVDAFLVKNGIRKDIYKLDGEVVAKRKKGNLRVLVEGPLKVFFKNVEKTLRLCHESKADEIWLLTSSDVTEHKYADKVFSRVPIFKTAEIYRSCDVIIKLSFVEGMFGPPLEMFHCGGTAIVYNVTGHDEYMKGGYNSYIVNKNDEKKVIEYINHLKADANDLSTLKQNAINTAESWYTWTEASVFFEEALRSIVQSGEETLQISILKQRIQFFEDWYKLSNHIISSRYNNLLIKIIFKIKRKLSQLIISLKDKIF